MNISSELWEEWFDAQYALCDQMDRAVAGLSAGKDDAYRAAVWSAVIEHAAEAIRMCVSPAEEARSGSSALARLREQWELLTAEEKVEARAHLGQQSAAGVG